MNEPEPIHVSAYKAAQTGNRLVPSATIEIRSELPETADATALAALLLQNATWIGDALVRVLPGGSIDQLLVQLLRHQAMLYRVSHRPVEPVIAERYFLEAVEEGKRLPVGNAAGYATSLEAETAALLTVDDALPRNIVRVLALTASAHLGVDGEPYIRTEP